MKIGICVRDYHKIDKYSCFERCMGVPKVFLDIFQNFNVTPVFLTMGCGLLEMIALTDGLIIPGSALSMHDLREYPVDKDIISQYLHRKPIFGICGGMQELCVALGGDIVEYGAKNHMNVQHDVTLNGTFRKLFNTDSLSVNSYHNHYCHIETDRLSDFELLAVDSKDLLLEAFQFGMNLGVQWHPEVMEREHYEKLFSYFFQMCME